jgi:hypothetical protein
MKCMTAQKSVNEGIKLWCDPAQTPEAKAKYTLHLPNNFWTVISDELLQSDCVRREGDDVILMRCSISKDRQIIPETAEDAASNDVFVLGVIDGQQVAFSDENPQPTQYRTAIGPNSCCHWLYEARHLNRGPNGQTTGHEEFRFLAVLTDGNRMEANVSFYNEDGSRLNMRASGPMLSYKDGVLQYHRPSVTRSF